MNLKVEGKLNPDHLDIILAEDLSDENRELYDLTLGQALREILNNEELIECNYTIDANYKLESFVAWTPTKVIFLNNSLFTYDALLDSVPRHPPTIERNVL